MRGPLAQTRYRPELDCGTHNHFWHVPICFWETRAYCSRCGKRRRKARAR